MQSRCAQAIPAHDDYRVALHAADACRPASPSCVSGALRARLWPAARLHIQPARTHVSAQLGTNRNSVVHMQATEMRRRQRCAAEHLSSWPLSGSSFVRGRAANSALSRTSTT